MNSRLAPKTQGHGQAADGMSPSNLLLSRATSAQPGRRNRLARFFRILDLYQSDFGRLPKTIKITGTSGKGSVCAILESILLKDGSRVCTFTSPHLTSPNERIRLNGSVISNEAFDSAAEEAKPFFDEIINVLGKESQPSFFETMLLLALHISRTASVNILLLEVAVGGYNDVVSLFSSPLSAITTIDLDHLNELGNCVEEIAADKAGIASSGSTLVLGPSVVDPAKSIIFTDVNRRGVEIVQADRSRIVSLDNTRSGFEVQVGNLRLKFPLPGAFQLDNLATAITLFESARSLGWAHAWSSIAGASRAHWPARLEFVSGPPDWLLDAAHNPLAFVELRKYLEEYYPSSKIALVFGASEKDKAIEGLQLLAPLFTTIFFTGGFYRSAIHALDELYLSPSLAGKTVFASSPLEALHLVRSHDYQFDLTVVTGSIFLVGCWKDLLASSPSPASELE